MKNNTKLPSDRSFALTFVFVFSLVGDWMALKGISYSRWAFAGVVIFFVLAYAAPRALHLLNVAWLHFGELLHKIVSPVALGLVFFGLITPISLFFRITGRDALRRQIRDGQKSYWIERTPSEPGTNDFRRQF